MVEFISRCSVAIGAAMSVAVATPVAAAPDDAEPLEVVAVDVSDFPRVVVDVALPDRELAGDVRAGDFEMPGAAGVVAEALAAADLTVAVALDDGDAMAPETILTQQGAITELVRNIPADVELLIAAASGGTSGPTTDRSDTLAAIATLGAAAPGEASSLGATAIRAAGLLEAVPDGRRQLVVVTGAGADITPEEGDQLMSPLDTMTSALRVLSIGGPTGPELSAVASMTGGFAVDVGTGPAAALRAVDVLTTTFTDQYRLTGTLAGPGDQVVRLTVSGRRYETVVPDLGASAVAPTTTLPPTTIATTSTSTSSTTSPPTTSPGPAAAVGPPSADELGGGQPEGDDRSPSMIAGAQGIVAIAAIAVLVAAVVRRRRPARR